MKLLKTLIFSLIWLSTISFWFGIEFYYDYTENTAQEDYVEIGKIIKDDGVTNQEWSLEKLLNLFDLSGQPRYDAGTSKAIYYAKMIVNMLLSFVSFIALIMLIYAFYMMFFSKEESWMTKAKQVFADTTSGGVTPSSVSSATSTISTTP